MRSSVKTENNTIPQIIGHSVVAALGLALFAVGTYFTIQANIGVAPWDCFYLGIQNTFGFQYGNISLCASLIIIVIDLLIKERIGIGTILDALIVGKTVDLCSWLGFLPEQTDPVMGVVIMVIGLIINGFGQYIYMKMALCCGPRDALLVGLSKRMPRVPIGIVSVMIMAVVLVLGWALGGPVGIGTIIGTFCMGPIMQAVFQVMRFRPKEVKHQDIIATARIIGGAAGARGEGGSGEASSFGAASSSGEARDRQDV